MGSNNNHYIVSPNNFLPVLYASNMSLDTENITHLYNFECKLLKVYVAFKLEEFWFDLSLFHVFTVQCKDIHLHKYSSNYTNTNTTLPAIATSK